MTGPSSSGRAFVFCQARRTTRLPRSGALSASPDGVRAENVVRGALRELLVDAALIWGELIDLERARLMSAASSTVGG